jgi:ribosomal protein S18 acetylase RimI-like enzyme
MLSEAKHLWFISMDDRHTDNQRFFASLRMTWRDGCRVLHHNMSNQIVTREFSIDDYDDVLQLWQTVEGLEIAEGDDREGIAQFLAHNPGLSRLAIDGSKVVGVSMCGNDGRRGHIYHVAVDPAYRRYGLGKRLVQECLDGLRRVGIVRAIILVADYNLRGAEFWKRAGWEDIPGAVPMGIDV